MAIDLQIENISKSFGDLVLFSDISFTVEERQRIGLIACNGKGKSTLLKIIAGQESLDDGKITFRSDIKVGYLEQEPDFDGELSVIEACLQRNGEKAGVIARYEAAMESDDPASLQHLVEEMDRLDAWDYENRAKQVLAELLDAGLALPAPKEAEDDGLITFGDLSAQTVADKLRATDLNMLSPYEAMTLLFELKKLL